MGGEVGARILNRGKHDDYSKAKGSSRNAVDLEQRIKVFRVRCRSNLRLYDRDVLVIARQQAISTQAFHLCSSASDLHASISPLLVSKSDFLASISLLLVRKGDFLVAVELGSFSDGLSTSGGPQPGQPRDGPPAPSLQL